MKELKKSTGHITVRLEISIDKEGELFVSNAEIVGKEGSKSEKDIRVFWAELDIPEFSLQHEE
jgi:hypothetical protein